MSKPIDFYSGYPNQQRLPRWVGYTLGSLFGAMMLIAVSVGARLLWPARAAEAAVVKPIAPPTAGQPLLAPPAATTNAVATAATDVGAPRAVGKHHHHGKHMKGAVALAAHRPSKADAHFKKAQLYAKHMSGSRRDKRARDDLDKLLGM
jgi:hypothetical protein